MLLLPVGCWGKKKFRSSAFRNLNIHSYAGADVTFEHDLDCDRTSDSPMITDFGCSGIEHSLHTCPHVVNSTCEGGRAGVICFPGF